MESKFYTPKIEEFYIGFEYEYKYSENVWKKCICKKSDFTDLNYHIKNNLRRIKYLDKEDIESFGFKYYDKIEDSIYFKYKSFRLAFNPIANKVEIVELGPCHFRGSIKNKSELKVVLKQIGIVNE